jgi:hypothetical protein
LNRDFDNKSTTTIDDDDLLPKRNLFVTYKAYPTHEKLVTSVMYDQSAPDFFHTAQFPCLMTHSTIDEMENFSFVLEVWDRINSGRDELVGLVKIPLSSFCYSMRTSEEDIFSLNFLADQHNMYPLCIVDDSLPIYNPRLGCTVGQLKVRL